MKKLISVLAGLALGVVGCATSFQGIKVRAQSPPIDEAFRKLSLAIALDGYEISSVEPSRFFLVTSWRPLKENEKSNADRTVSGQTIQSQITVRLERRGGLFDVFMTPMLRYVTGDTSHDVIADVHHPLWEKWQRALTSIVQKEFREED